MSNLSDRLRERFVDPDAGLNEPYNRDGDEAADALDAMESALRAVIAAPVTLAVPTDDECPWRHQIIARAALLRLEGK